MIPLVARLYFAPERSLANSMYGEPMCVRGNIRFSYSNPFLRRAQNAYTGTPSARIPIPSSVFAGYL